MIFEVNSSFQYSVHRLNKDLSKKGKEFEKRFLKYFPKDFIMSLNVEASFVLRNRFLAYITRNFS